MPNGKERISERMYIILQDLLIALRFSAVQSIQCLGYQLDGPGIESRQGKMIPLDSK